MDKAKFRATLSSTSLPLVGAVVLFGTLMAVINVSAQIVDPLSVVMLQGFNWDSWKYAPTPSSWYRRLQEAADDIAAAGITDVWFPPPSQSADEHGYMPGELYDLDSSKYGTEAQLKAAIAAFQEKGVRAISDIVINHRTGSKKDDKGNYCVFEGGTDDNRLDWAGWAVPPGDMPYKYCGSGNADTGKDYRNAPDVDHKNPRVQQELSDWMNWLKSEIGFQGWTFNFVQGYAADILGRYVANTSAAFAVGDLGEDLIIGQEDAHRHNIVTWIHRTGHRSSAFDFTTKGVLQHAVQHNELGRMNLSGKPPGVIGVLPEKAVTFIDNHDTALPQNISLGHFPYDKLLQGYAYILTHPGVPCIFYDHFFDGNLNETITKLVATRKKHKIKANSAVRIITAQSDLYMASIDEEVVVKIGARMQLGNLVPGSEFKIVTSGEGFKVWEKVNYIVLSLTIGVQEL